MEMRLVKFLFTNLFWFGIARSAPSSSSPPVPEETHWKVSDGLITCIKADLKIRFDIPSGNGTKYLVLPPSANTNKSSCNDPNVLWLHSDNEFDFVITFEKNSGKTFTKNVTLQLLSTETGVFFNDSWLFMSSSDHYYGCKSLLSVPLGNATMEIFDMTIQAFGSVDEYFATGETCPDDQFNYWLGKFYMAIAFFGLGFIIGKYITKACCYYFGKKSNYKPLL